MAPTPVHLSRTEQRVVGSVVIVWVVGELSLRGVGSATGTWWPLFALLGCFIVFAVGFTVYVCRTRSRSVGSLLSLALPDRLRHRVH